MRFTIEWAQLIHLSEDPREGGRIRKGSSSVLGQHLSFVRVGVHGDDGARRTDQDFAIGIAIQTIFHTRQLQHCNYKISKLYLLGK